MRFPDASDRPPTTVRATHRLEPSGRRWVGNGFVATPDTWHEAPVLRVEMPGEGPETYRTAWLDYLGAGKGYAGGCWVGGTATGFTARKDGAALVLELWDVEDRAPGWLHLPMVDGA